MYCETKLAYLFIPLIMTTMRLFNSLVHGMRSPIAFQQLLVHTNQGRGNRNFVHRISSSYPPNSLQNKPSSYHKQRTKTHLFSTLSTSSIEIVELKTKITEAIQLCQQNKESCQSKSTLEQIQKDLEQETSDPDFWSNPEDPNTKRVQGQLSSVTKLLDRLKLWEQYQGECEAGLELLNELLLVNNENNEEGEMILTIIDECTEAASLLYDDGKKFELEQLMSGKFDSRPARIVISAGAGKYHQCMTQ